MGDLGSNSFVAARLRLRTVMIGALLACVGSVFTPMSYLTLKLFFTVTTVALFAAMVWIIVRECRCPHCGKIIFLGALSAASCPRCRRSLTTGKKQKKSGK